MKIFAVCIPLLAIAGSLFGGEPKVFLRGIVSWRDAEIALLEDTTFPGPGGELMLGKGQRNGDIEVLGIEPKSGTARITRSGETVELALDKAIPATRVEASGKNSTEPPLLRLRNAPHTMVFALYQRLSGRNLVRPQNVPAFRLDLSCENAASAGDLVKALEQSLVAKGLVFRLERDKFMLLGSQTDLKRITPGLWDVAVTLGRKSRGSSDGPDEVLPAGAIVFSGTDLGFVLRVYQELTDRTLIRSPLLPQIQVTFSTCTALSRTEAIYVLAAVLGMNGVDVVPDGDKFLVVFPQVDKERVDALLKDKKPNRSLPDGKAVPAGTINFQNSPLRQVAALYQDLSGKTVQLPANFPERGFTIRTQGMLSASETLRALDLLLGVSGLSLVDAEDEKGLKLVNR